MDIKNIETFIRVAEIGNFSRTAEELGYAQSTVTMQIKQLENEVGVQLFERQGKKVSLSKEGRQFLEYAYHVSKCTSEMKESFSGSREPSGILTIGIVESLCSAVFKEISQEYIKQWPNVRLKVKISGTEEILQMLKQNHVDLIITLDEEVKSQDLKLALRKEENVTFFCSRSNPLASGDIWMLQDILEEKFILPGEKNICHKHFTRLVEESSIHISSPVEIESSDFMIEYVNKNLGISFLPEILLAASSKKGGLHMFAVPDCQTKLYTQLIYKKDKWLSPAMKEFIDIARVKIYSIL